ncbi:hypothetical protein MKW98_031041 [Papaver atlanticum]|uniref:HMA domain-containing protein n=1 Tax=Papaver atlanticum TaxID=357466 RepID=A0AAD4XLR1_9MAGN|nr:hypothetical protein MKW98_031041 [Papaver atlanticum]
MMVVKMDISDEKYKLKAMKSVSGFAGVDSISWDMKEAQKKLTVIGDIDPVDIVIKLRKHSHTELLLKMMVVKMDISDEKHKLKAMKSVSGLAGVDSISWDMKEAQHKLTITGDVDPCNAELVSFGQAKEPEKKKEEPKKEEPKKSQQRAA